MSKVANVFKDGDPVIVKATATKPNGDKLPQAGKRGLITGTPKPGRHMVDVPGMPLVNLLAEDLDSVASNAASDLTDAMAKVVAKGDTPDAPLPPAPAAPAQAAAYAFDVLELRLIVASLTNPRSYFDPVALQSLADDIAHNGILQPLLVRRLPGARLEETFSDRRKGDPRPTHEIVAGERRYRASVMAGVRSVPVLIRDLTDEQVLRMQLIENVQREDLHPLEEAQGYRRILDLESQADKPMAVRVEELAAGIKKSTRYIYQTLQLLQLCEFSRKVFLEGKLQRTTALQIATIGNEAGQIEATRRIAGLSHKTTEVVNNPMSQREAAAYVHGNHRLVLSKAPFPVKVEFAGAVACTACPKMSANAADLFDQGAKVPDTCMDPSCYGRKNVAHSEALATAARAKGQRVITGAEAKKIIPYEHYENNLQGSFEGLDERRYDVEPNKQGNTIRQLLGKDMPLPVLIANPHKTGFIEALPKADVNRLLKERGLMRKAGGRSEDDKAAERKDKAEKAYRWALAEQLLARADNVDDIELFEDLIVPMAAQVYRRLDNECTKRTHKLMGWDFASFGYDQHAKLLKHFEDLSAGDMNKFLIAASISSELHIAQYCRPSSNYLDCMSGILKVDAKALKAKLQAEAKAIEKAKADKAKAKAAPAAKKAPVPGAMPTKFAVGQRVQFKEALRGPTGHFRKVSGREGIVSSIAGDAYMVRTDGGNDVARAEVSELVAVEPATAKPANKTQWRNATEDEDALQVGDRVRIDSDLAMLSAPVKKYAGKVGLLSGRVGPAAWFVNFAKPGQKADVPVQSFHVVELQVETEPGEAIKKPEPAAKKPAAKKSATQDMQTALDLPAPSKALDPAAAWPFPKEARP